MIDGFTLIKGLFYFMLKGKEGGKYLSRKRVTGKNGKARWVYDYGKKKGKIVREKAENDDKKSMKIEDKNGFIKYTVNKDEITLDLIKTHEKRKGTAKELIKKLKAIAREKELPIGLYAEPQDDSISESDLIEFYKKQGFDEDVNDTDGKLLIWNP